MASKQASKRLQKEYVAIQKEPPPFIITRPDESNILSWHFILRGPPDTPYYGGEYYGVVLFPADYPFAPPGIKVHTPSGRFSPGAAICTSMSNFHPGSWNPAWSCASILTGLLSFMLSEEITTGSMRGTDAERKALAATSHAWNLTNPKFKSILSDYATPTMRDLPNMGPPEVPKPSDVNSSTLPLHSPLANILNSNGHNPLAGKDRPAGIISRWRKEIMGGAVVLLVSWAVMRSLE